MKETDLDYGAFVKPQTCSVDADSGNSKEKNLDENIQTINKHFKSKSKKTKNKKNSEDQISVVATIDDEDAVTIAGPEKKEKKSKQKDEPKKHITSIGVKLIGIITTLIVVSMGLITVLVSYFVTKDTKANAEITNFTLNSRTTSDCENRINSIISGVSLYCDLLDDNQASEDELALSTAKLFDRNPDVLAIGFVTDDNLFVNQALLVSKNISADSIKAYISTETDAVNYAKNGLMKIRNASPFLMNPAITVFFSQNISFNGENKNEVLAVVISTEKLSESIATGRINESFLINDEGVILIHPDAQMMMQAADFSENAFVKNVVENDRDGIQLTYIDSKGEEYIAACKKITAADCRVITQTKTAVILAAIKNTTKNNIALTVAILSIAILIVWIFAKSLSIPLKKLTSVTEEINKGNFNTVLFEKLNVHRKDEIGVLNRSTKDERDILNTVTKLTNKGVTKAIVKKEIDFEPHLKDITIFFSDIRGFTSISDSFNKKFGEKSAAEIISFLNDYMSRMVNCISISGGVVDKFEGDAIMAAWGVLRESNLDYEQLPEGSEEKAKLEEIHNRHVKQDAISAIRATMAMRYALMKYNKDAKAFTKAHKNDPLASYKPQIKIGCGLNTGRATVGFMGSYEKMEFTSIGDAVNLASRTESSNKPCGTDILITQDTYDILKKDYIKCKENGYKIPEENRCDEIKVEKIPVSFSVKGKDAQHFYGVVNMPNFDIKSFFEVSEPGFVPDQDCLKAAGPEGPETLADVRNMLGIPTPDFSKVNLNAEENKVAVK